MQPVATQRSKSDACIDLAIGQPDPELLPVDCFHGLATAREALAYGAERGYPGFLQALAAWLTQQMGTAVDAAELMATNGSSNALSMICTQFAKPGDVVLVEDPTYFIARRLFLEHGLRVVSVAMDEEGVCPTALARQIAEHEPAFFYTVASFHNPTGITMTLSRRRAILDLARQTRCLVVSDDIYQLLHFNQPPPLPLSCLDVQAPVISIGSLSKILAPGLRLGWMHANRMILDRMVGSALLDSGGGLNPFTSQLITPLLRDGRLTAHLASLRRTYHKRSQVLSESLREHIRVPITMSEPQGGFFLWLDCTEINSVSTLLSAAHEQGVGFLPGNKCSDSAEMARAMRLCFAYFCEESLALAGKRLAMVLNQASRR